MEIQEALLRVKARAVEVYKRDNGSTDGFQKFWEACEPELLSIASQVSEEAEEVETGPKRLSDFQSDTEKLEFIRERGFDAYYEIALRG